MLMLTMTGMKVPLWIATVVLAVILSSTSLARIGETIEQCAVRYGDPLKENESWWPNSPAVPAGFPLLVGEGLVLHPGRAPKTLYFKKSGLFIIVSFWKGKAAIVSFGKVSVSGSMEKLSDVEVETLLAANAAGKWTWINFPRSVTDGGKRDLWLSEDRKVYADRDCIATVPMLSIRTGEYATRHDTEEKKNLEGF